jgi:hypothetical protein
MKLLPTLGSDLRGSLAGITASKNRGGNYLRARRVPSKPNTPAQQLIKSTLAALSSYWSNTLTAAQQASWNQYGKTNPVKNNLGQTIILSGLQMFMRINSPVVASQGIAGVIATSPGAVPFLSAPQFGTTSVASSGGAISAVLDFAANLTVGDFLFLYISRPNAVGKVASHQPGRLVIAHKVVTMEAGMKTITLTGTDPFTGRPSTSAAQFRAVWVSGSNLSGYGFTTIPTT